LIDPEVGALFYIVPVFALGKGVSNRRSFVDAVFLPSAQGLALVPNTEDLSLYSSSSGLEIRGPAGGMRFSSEDMMSYLARKKINKRTHLESGFFVLYQAIHQGFFDERACRESRTFKARDLPPFQEQGGASK